MLKPCLTSFTVFFINVLLAIFLFSSCESEKEIVPELFKPRYNHEAYLHALDQAGLLNAALGTDWQVAAKVALTDPLHIETPYAEDFYLDPAVASAIGYRFSAQRGHKIEIGVDLKSRDSIDVFLDVFRIDDDSLGLYTHIASAVKDDLIVGFEPVIDGEYILRLQTELLRGGFFRIEIQKVPAFSFPVSGKDKSAIGSLFGVPRDGGRRKHHGVDIFSRRHTPIIAPTQGRIRRVGEGGLGGKVVWMRDDIRNQTLYFAHLEDILVERGDYVYPGDTLGTVGNTGNARTTPPHLHFGIYKNGPINPYNFIANTRTKLKRELADKNLVGKVVRARKGTRLKVSGMTKKNSFIEVSKFQIMEARGASAAYFRVKLPDETEGYILYDAVEIADRPIKRQIASADNPLLSNPGMTALPVNFIKPGEQLNILGGNEDYYFVEQASGRKGWIQAL